MLKNLCSFSALNININVEHGNTLWIEEAPRKCCSCFPLRINLSYIKKIKKNETNTRTTTRAYKSSGVPTLFNNFLKIEIICAPMSLINFRRNPSHTQALINRIINFCCLESFIFFKTKNNCICQLLITLIIRIPKVFQIRYKRTPIFLINRITSKILPRKLRYIKRLHQRKFFATIGNLLNRAITSFKLFLC